MTDQYMVAKEDYSDDKPACFLYVGLIKTCCGSPLKMTGLGYYASTCAKELKKGDTVYFRNDCECGSVGPYCSIACVWSKCFSCERLICKECYRYSANSCAYCVDEIKRTTTLKRNLRHR